MRNLCGIFTVTVCISILTITTAFAQCANCRRAPTFANYNSQAVWGQSTAVYNTPMKVITAPVVQSTVVQPSVEQAIVSQAVQPQSDVVRSTTIVLLNL